MGQSSEEQGGPGSREKLRDKEEVKSLGADSNTPGLGVIADILKVT